MDPDYTASEIQQIDAAVQRLLALRAEHGAAPQHPLLKETLAQIDQAIAELQVIFDELSHRTGDVQRLASEIEMERIRRIELMETLPVPCLFTDAAGTIQEANTSALLLLGGSLQGLGRDSLRQYVADVAAYATFIANLASDATVTGTLMLRRSDGSPFIISVSASPIRNVQPPVWRWFFWRATAPAADTRERASRA